MFNTYDSIVSPSCTHHSGLFRRNLQVIYDGIIPPCSFAPKDIVDSTMPWCHSAMVVVISGLCDIGKYHITVRPLPRGVRSPNVSSRLVAEKCNNCTHFYSAPVINALMSYGKKDGSQKLSAPTPQPVLEVCSIMQ